MNTKTQQELIAIADLLIKKGYVYEGLRLKIIIIEITIKDLNWFNRIKMLNKLRKVAKSLEEYESAK